MSTTHNRSNLVIFDAETKQQEFKIAATQAKTAVSGAVPIEFAQAVSLQHPSGDFADCADTLHSTAGVREAAGRTFSCPMCDCAVASSVKLYL